MRGVFSPAVSTSITNASGGTALCTQESLPSSHLFCAPGCHYDVTEQPFHDITPVQLRFWGFNFVVVSIYLTSGIGFAGENVEKLALLAIFLSVLREPYLLIGDWNITPTEMSNSSWFKYMKCHIVVPSNVDATCSMGEGSLLDYAIINDGMRFFSRAACNHCALATTPWIEMVTHFTKHSHLDENTSYSSKLYF